MAWVLVASNVLSSEQLQAALLDLAEFQEIYVSGPEGARQLAGAVPFPVAVRRFDGLTRVEPQGSSPEPGRLRAALIRLTRRL